MGKLSLILEEFNVTYDMVIILAIDITNCYNTISYLYLLGEDLVIPKIN